MNTALVFTGQGLFVKSHNRAMLKETFSALLENYTADSDVINSYWQEIELAYSHRKRHYHTLVHLENMLNELLDVKSRISNWQAVLFALYYHDVVYNALKSNNEELSADFAVERLKSIQVPDEQIQACYDLIIATKKHQLSDNSDTNYFTDADLSVLGKETPIYKAYSQNVRKEYSLFPDIIYNPGRKKVLKHFLEMDRIFKTDYFLQKYEKQAKENLSWEMASL